MKKYIVYESDLSYYLCNDRDFRVVQLNKHNIDRERENLDSGRGICISQIPSSVILSELISFDDIEELNDMPEWFI